MNTTSNSHGKCSCGTFKFETLGSPIFRAYCHCTLCQKYSKAAFADVTVFYAKHVDVLDETNIDFTFYKDPPMVSRGSCKQCGEAAYEKISVPLMPNLITIPSTNFANVTLLPKPVMHIFYDKRTADVEDGLRKHEGFASSQLAFSAGLIKGMIFRACGKRT